MIIPLPPPRKRVSGCNTIPACARHKQPLQNPNNYPRPMHTLNKGYQPIRRPAPHTPRRAQLQTPFRQAPKPLRFILQYNCTCERRLSSMAFLFALPMPAAPLTSSTVQLPSARVASTLLDVVLANAPLPPGRCQAFLQQKEAVRIMA